MPPDRIEEYSAVGHRPRSQPACFSSCGVPRKKESKMRGEAEAVGGERRWAVGVVARRSRVRKCRRLDDGLGSDTGGIRGRCGAARSEALASAEARRRASVL